MMLLPVIFDLDHTVIDSSHRQATLPDGSLDLAHWRENSTAEKIMQDKLLPLAKVWRDLQNSPAVCIIVCTARVMGKADFAFLESHGLRYDVCLSRKLEDTTPDDILKILSLKSFAGKIGYSWKRFTAASRIYDDNQKVLNICKKHGILAIDSIEENNKLRAA